MIYFKVDGECVPKQRPRMTKTGHAFTPQKTKEYEQKVLLAYLEKYRNHAKPYYDEDTAIIMWVTIHQSIPASFNKKKAQQALDEEIVPVSHKGDVDNFLKTIADAVCNGTIVKDDCAVYEAHVRKVYSLTAYAEVTIMSREEWLELKGEKDVASEFITNLP